MLGSQNPYFDRLILAVEAKARENLSFSNPDIRKWKGEDILKFQEDLEEQVHGRVSEKWFYSHIKARHDRLPRIDVLNMLSKYAGYEDWTEFLKQENIPFEEKRERQSRRWMNFYVISAGVFLVGIVFASGTWFFYQEEEYIFCFVDQDQNAPIKEVELEVSVLFDNESPIQIKCDKKGCFTWTSDRDHVTFVVNSAYYYSDTITRYHRTKKHREIIPLKTNDYALMLHYFSSSSVRNWKARRASLDQMFMKDAVIYHVMGPGQIGMEMLNKEQFIDKMTMPLSSLKNIEVLTTQYTGNKISLLKFKQGGTK